MNLKFSVDVLECKDIHELPDAWTGAHLRTLLDIIEYEDPTSIADGDLREMTSMALSDLEPEVAAEAVLSLRFGERMTPGQRQDLSVDMQEGKIWEEYGNMAFHEELFNAACMLHWTFDRKFPKPVCTSIKLHVTAANANAARVLKNPKAAFIARLLNDGMDDHNAIHRLFHDEIASETFKEAEDIIWNFTASTFDESTQSCDLHIHTSWNWVDELKGIKQYESTAHPDE